MLGSRRVYFAFLCYSRSSNKLCFKCKYQVIPEEIYNSIRCMTSLTSLEPLPTTHEPIQ